MKTLSEIELVNLYQAGNSEAAEVLIQKFEPLLVKLSKNHTSKYKQVLFEDTIQNAKLGALIAFQRFKYNQNAKLSTFLHTTVYHYLLTCNDQEAFVNCPTNLREVRSYIGGKYENSIKKQEFEKKYDIKTNNDKEQLCVNYSLLNPENIYLFPDDEMPENNVEEVLTNNLFSGLFLNTLDAEDQKITTLLIEGYNQTKIADILTKELHPITAKQINTRINIIKKKFVKYYYG